MDVTFCSLRRTAMGLFATLCLTAGAHAAPIDDALAAQKAAIAQLQALATASAAAAASTAPDWKVMEAQLEQVFLRTARMSDFAQADRLKTMTLCLNLFDAQIALLAPAEAELKAASGNEGAAHGTMKELLAHSRPMRRNQTRIFLEQTRCSTQVLLLDAATWPVESGPSDDTNRMLGLLVAPVRAFSLASFGGLLDPAIGPQERAELAAQVLPVAKELAQALPPEMRGAVPEALERDLDKAALPDRATVQPVLDAFRTDACALSCERSRGRLADETARNGR
jgi:hypothetical protein